MGERFDREGRPMQVKVGPYDYTIEWHPKLCSHHESRGQQYETELQIKIDPAMPPHMVSVVFLHEVLHAIFMLTYRVGKELGLEEQADMYSTGLAAFWRDNPGAFKWWGGLIG